MTRCLRAVTLAAALVLPALPAAVHAQGLPPAYAVPPADREVFAGVSYRDATIGTLFLAGGALVIGALTGSPLTAASAAIAAGATFLIFEPGNSRFQSKVAAPTTRELRRDKTRE